MAETRRKFDADFKEAREPGINEGTLGNWVCRECEEVA